MVNDDKFNKKEFLRKAKYVSENKDYIKQSIHKYFKCLDNSANKNHVANDNENNNVITNKK